ncbi:MULTISPECIES: phage tail sheath subtilisin-like domain-containing protein [unclassified Microcoleus]|uniref:phage tail sheath subtilisin-like domain-containing protein n=1 Tax=unclassified Microcoleus TaxID=2642155 RepID=UPI002FD58FD8
MTTYLSPGVYVKEVSSGSAPIAGAGTSTAAFIGIVSDTITIPTAPIIETQQKFSVKKSPIVLENQTLSKKGSEDGIYTWSPSTVINKKIQINQIIMDDHNIFNNSDFTVTPPQNEQTIYTINFRVAPNISKPVKIDYIGQDVVTEFLWESKPDLLGDWEIWVGDNKLTENQVKIELGNKVIFTPPLAPNDDFIIKYKVLANQVTNELIGKLVAPNGEDKDFTLKRYPVNTTQSTFTIKIDGKPDISISDRPEVKLENDPVKKIAKLTIPKSVISLVVSDNQVKIVTVDYQVTFPKFEIYAAQEKVKVKLCTNFNEFKNLFGDFSQDEGQKQLAHAVYGFFNNGGTRCYVMVVKTVSEIFDNLEKLEAIDEISMVAAPGITSELVRSAIITHCQKIGDRFAILDCGENDTSADITNKKPANSNYAAFYFPWIQVFDPATKTANPDGDGLIYVPPSGHIAGIYARVDAQRGVHKAPANEIVLGALGLKQNLSKSQQDGLNPQGINCIRNLNGNIRVWGARTIGGDENGEFKYINVRRLFNYLKKSIDQGTQWTVFEPNSPELWAKIRRNVTSFLMTVWRSGALFGSTPEQAFYVKCDEETNPPELREQGQVITEIGVAIVKPAEFVIFNLSQWSGPGK